ncbi:MAG: LysR family transcriptional regulator [Erysipelotrichaceae bacterium]
MNMQIINSFVTLCEDKNISRCSQKLHISQQGLSRQIKHMEDTLGCRLFIRSSKGVQPTAEAMILLPGFRKAQENYYTALKELSAYKNNIKETICVSICPGIKQALGLDFFMKFQSENPNITLKLDFQSDVVCEEKLFQRKSDAAFLDWPVHEEEFDTYLVVRSPLMAVLRKDNPLASKSSISMKELYGMHIYIPDESHRMSQRFKHNWPEIYNSVVIDSTSNDYDCFYNDLPKNMGGIALTFRFLLDRLDSQLIAIPIKEESFISLYYCTIKDAPQSRALALFSDYIYKNVDVLE